MPTRTSSKPSSYTFNSAHEHGDTMIAGYIFIASDVSGSTITDITGNGVNITMQGTASIASTDATHGDCLDPGDSGATVDPAADPFDSQTNYTAAVGVRIDNNDTAVTELLIALHNTGGSQDSMQITWLASENVAATFEDADTSNVSATITDGILNNAGEWATVVAVNDAANDTVYCYVIIDGETTQVTSVNPSNISGSVLNNLLGLGGGVSSPWHGLIEYAYIWSEAKTQTELESIHVDPYQMLDAGADPNVGSGFIYGNKLHRISLL